MKKVRAMPCGVLTSLKISLEVRIAANTIKKYEIAYIEIIERVIGNL